MPFLNVSSTPNSTPNYNGLTITPVESRPVNRSTEAISRLLEAAHYTEREERGELMDMEVGDEDIEEVEVEGEGETEGETEGNNQWSNTMIFRSSRVRKFYYAFLKIINL